MRRGYRNPRMWRQMMWKQMFHQMGGPGWHHHGGEDCWERPSPEQRIAFLQEYQRDLEQQVADVAAKIKRLREEMATEATES